MKTLRMIDALLLVASLCGLVVPSASFSYLTGKSVKGMAPSFGVGPYGMPVFSFYRAADETLAFGMCQDSNCEQAVVATPLVRNIRGVRAKMALDLEGNPLIVFTDETNKLQLVRCPDIDCEDVSDIVTIATLSGTPESAPAVAFLPSGLPAIAFEDRGSDILRLAMCSTLNCTGTTTFLNLTGANEMGSHPILLISNRRPLVFYHEDDSRCIRAIHCTDDTCTSTKQANVVCSNAGQHFSATMGIDQNAVLSHYSTETKDLRISKCRDASCSTSLTTFVDRLQDVGAGSAILSPFDGRPIIVYADDSLGCTKIARCKDIRCRDGADAHVIANTPRHGTGFAIANGLDGIPIMIYESEDLGTFQTIKCLAASCDDAFTTHKIPALQPIGYNPTIVATPSSKFVGVVGTTAPKGSLSITYCLTDDCSPGNIPVTLDTVKATLTSAARLESGALAVAYFDPTLNTVNLLLCRSRDCQAFDRVIVESSVVVETPTTINVDPNGFTVVAYYDTVSASLRIARCNRADCSTGMTLNTVDSSGNAGRYPSLAFFAENQPVITYLDADNGFLRLAYCLTPSCASVNRVIVDGSGNAGSHSAVAVTASNEVLISYHNYAGKALMYAYCAAVTCTSPSIVVVDNLGAVGTQTSIALSPEGLASIAYKDVTNNRLKVATCADLECRTSSLEVADDRFGSGERPTIALSGSALTRGFIITHYNSVTKSLHAISCQLASCSYTVVEALLASGVDEHVAMGCHNCDQPIVVYNDLSQNALAIAHCADNQCWSPYVTAVLNIPYDIAAPDAAPTKDGLVVASFNTRMQRAILHKCVGTKCTRMAGFPVDRPTVNPTVVVGADDIATVAFYDPLHGDLKVSRCMSKDCKVASLNTVDSNGNAGNHASMVLGTDGFPVISYYNSGTCDLLVAVCSDSECALPAKIVGVDKDCKVGKFTSITLDAVGNPIIAYYDDLRNRMKLAHCTSTDCSGDIHLTLQSNGNNVGVSATVVLSSVQKPMLAAIDSTTGNVVFSACDGMYCSLPPRVYNVPRTENVVGGIDLVRSSSSMLIAHHDNVTHSLMITSIECPPGTFLSSSPHRCLPCAPGTFTSIRSQTSCSPCESGTYSPVGATQCFNCNGVPPIWKQQCSADSAAYRDGMYLECMQTEELYEFTYKHILENKGTSCLRFEKSFSGYTFEVTEQHNDLRDGFMVKKCLEVGGCNCTQIVPCDKTTNSCQRPLRCTSVDGRRNCIVPIPCKKSKLASGAILLKFDTSGKLAFKDLPLFKQRKLSESIKRDLSMCSAACSFGDVEIVDEDTLGFISLDDATRLKMIACIPTIKISGRLFSKKSTYPFLEMVA